jgi:Spy/CpxP family protein refolding chaperone
MRNQYKVAGLVFFVILTLSFIAVAQTSPQSSQPQATPQSQPSPQDQTAPTSAAPQGRTEGQQPAAPQGQAGSTSNSQQGSASQPGSVEDELHLTDAQKEKLRPIIQEEVSQINAVREDQSMTMDQKRAKVDQIRQTEFPKIQAILTPEQIAKLKEMQQRQQQGQGGAPPSSSQQPPQQQPPQ